MKYRQLRKWVNKRLKDVKVKAKQKPDDNIGRAMVDAWQRCREALILKIRRDRKLGRQNKRIRKLTSSMKRMAINNGKAAEAINKLSGVLQELSREGKLGYLTHIANRRYPRNAYTNYNKQ